MAKVSDLIEDLIKEMMAANDGYAEITRGALAEKVNCVPSQITYVLSTRFTTGQGYRVESRRGGGGSIRIYRIDADNDLTGYIMHVVNAMGKTMSRQQADVYLQNFLDYSVISPRIARLMAAAISDQALEDLEPGLRDQVRMKIMKNMLVDLIIDK